MKVKSKTHLSAWAASKPASVFTNMIKLLNSYEQFRVFVWNITLNWPVIISSALEFSICYLQSKISKSVTKPYVSQIAE